MSSVIRGAELKWPAQMSGNRLKGLFTKFVFRSYLIFWIVMVCGISKI